MYIFNLTQSVTEPTHNLGHLLDLVLSKQSDNILLSTKLHHGLTFDHTAILCKLDVSVPLQEPETFQYRCLKKIDTNTFKQDLSDIFSPNSSVSDYNSHLRSVLDKHAPLPSHIPYEEADTLVQQYRGAVLQAEKGASEGRETLAQV